MTLATALMLVVATQTPDPVKLLDEVPLPAATPAAATSRCKDGEDTAVKAFEPKLQAVATSLATAQAGLMPTAGGMSAADGKLMQDIQAATTSRDPSQWYQPLQQAQDAFDTKIRTLSEARTRNEAACPQVTVGESTGPETKCVNAAHAKWKAAVKAAVAAGLTDANAVYAKSLKSVKSWATNVQAISDKAAKSKASFIKIQAVALPGQIVGDATELARWSSSATCRAAQAMATLDDGW